jgi:carbon-monoxide dehydrogenase medium subunit
MKETSYFAPSKIDEALKLLSQYGERAALLAGGTDLVAKINYYELQPEVLVYLGELGLDTLQEENGHLRIGSMTPTARLAADPLIALKAPALAEAARQSGSEAVRNASTIGGNLANASPAADLATPLLVMDAQISVSSLRGKRRVAIRDFFLGPGRTVILKDELITDIVIPPWKGKTGFLKLGKRQGMTLSVVNVAVRLEMTGQTCNDARIALGAMAPTPIRCRQAEKMLQGKGMDEGLISQGAAAAIAESQPIDDQRATAWYRRKAGEALVARALMQTAGLAKS